jgi:hypothetical protein
LGFALAQDVSQNQTLIVEGHTGQAAVIQVRGHSYADLEALARIFNASLSFNGNQIILKLPGSASSREWRGAIATAIRNSYPVTDEWMARLQNQATDACN